MTDSNKHLLLFIDPWCPFCYRVTSFLDSLAIAVPSVDITQDSSAYQELRKKGGKGTVPCLRIRGQTSEDYLYESLDIIEYLRNEFGAKSASR